MNLGDLKNIESVMIKIVNSELPIRIAFQLSMFIEVLDEKLMKLEEFRIKLVKKHGKADPMGNFQVEPKNMGAFTEELKELMDSEVQIDVVKIDIETFEQNNIKISIKDLNALIKAGIVDQIE